MDGDRAGRIFGEADGRAPAVLAHGAALAVAAKIGVDGVRQAHVQRFILAELTLGLAVGLDEFKKNFLSKMPKEDIIYNDKCSKILYKNNAWKRKSPQFYFFYKNL